MSPWILLVPGLPLGLALLMISPLARAWVPTLAPLALLPALAAVVMLPADTLLLDDWLLGLRLGLDTTGRVFLLFSALAWLCAALYARAWMATDPHRFRFTALFLLAMAGNLGLCIAQDALGFYLFFALMTFSAWGLILHRGHPAARHAGRTFLVLAVLGEAALLVALWFTVANGGADLALAPASVAAAPQRDLIIALLLVGFGVKAGLLGLHMSLPLAYDATPAPGAAVLASAMIKAGLLGWLRFLPLGAEALPGWSAVLIMLGFAAAFYGVVIGLLQSSPRVILAYSSISQMGLMIAGIGLGLASPAAAGPVLFAVTLYALHHALVKSALFLGEGLSRAAAHGLIFAGMVLLALLLAGAPLTGGALAKYHLKALLDLTPIASPGLLAGLLALASVGTSLLMARFLWQLHHRTRPTRRPRPALWLPWLLALLAALLLPWALVMDTAALRTPAGLWQAGWPVLAGIALAFIGRHGMGALAPRVPAGDILIPLERLLQQGWRRGRAVLRINLTRRWRRLRDPGQEALQRLAGPVLGERLEASLRPWRRFGVLGLLIAFSLAILLGAP
ncbi:MAG TPA: complex I subunit 5 family protein [Gammaproteobacteria bacterium]